MLRRFAEIVTRGISFRRSLPEEFGGRKICVSTEGGLRYLRRDLWSVDPVLLRAAREIVPETHVWDIGANVGLFTFAALHRAKSVLAVEPDPALMKLLRTSCKPDDAVCLLQAAVSDHDGVARFNIADRLRSANYLEGCGSSMTGGSRGCISVDTVTLDSLLDAHPAPSTVKIDIEGAEILALRGASRLLSEIRPRLHIEVAGEHSLEVTHILQRFQYSLFDSERENAPVPAAPFSTLAIPV